MPAQRLTLMAKTKRNYNGPMLALGSAFLFGASILDELDLAALGFDGVVPETTGRPAYHPATLGRVSACLSPIIPAPPLAC